MKLNIRFIAAVAMTCAVALGGCASTDNALSTSSVNQTKVAKFDPACVSLTAKIDSLRKEGTMARLAKVANGKSNSTRVKRSALAKAAELDNANAAFQAKCSTIKPAATATVKPVATTPAQQAVMNAAKKTVKAKAAKTVKTAATKTVVKAATAATKKK